MANAKKLWEKGQTKQKTTPAVSSGPAASAVDNIVKNTQSAAAGQQRVSQSAVDQMLADVQKSRYATVSEVIRAGQKPVTAQPAQQSKITAGRESTTPLQKQTGSASIKDRLSKMAQVSRIGKDSTANKPLPTMTAGGALAGITTKVRPAASDTVRKLNSLAADIRSNENDLINMNRRLSVLKAKANKGDASAVDSYNQLADRYNQKFDTYVANIGIYNTLYQGEYRDSAVRQNYAQRDYQEFRRQNRDAGVRQAYQQRRLEEELSAPRQIDIGKEGTRTIEHTPTRAEQAVGGALSYYGSGFAQAGGLIAKDLFREDGGQGHSATENVFNVGKSTEVAAAARAWDKVKAGGRDWADGLMKAGHELDERGEIQVKLAKQGLGTVGQALVDLGVVAIQMAGDIGLAVATGGSMLVPMGLRSYGNGYLTAEQMGYSGGEAELYGLGVAAVEVLSEKMFSVFSIAERYAKGVVKQEMSERVINAVVTRMAKSTTGRTALNRLMTLLFSAGSEGLEEVMAGIMEPVIRKATLDHSINVKQEIDWENALYEGLIGGILGGLGGSVDLRNTRATYWKYYKQGINENIERFEEAARKYGIESKEAQQAAKAVWDGGTRKMNEVAGTIDGRPVTYHQLAAMEEARAYGRTDGAQGPSLADSLNPESLGRYLENEEKIRRQEAARREEAARLEAEEKARVDAEKTAQSSPQDELTETSRAGASDEETVRLDTARSAQMRGTDVNNLTPQGLADLSEIPEEELTQEEKDELQYGSGAVEDLGRHAGLAQRMGRPNEDITRRVNDLAGRLQSKGLQSVERIKADPRMDGMRVGDVIFINERLSGAAAEAATMGHEVVHFAGDFDAQLINDLIAAMRRQGRDIDGLVETKREIYRKQFAEMGQAWDEEQMNQAYFEEEVAADFIGEICKADSRTLDKIAAEEPGLIRRIINALRQLLGRLTGSRQATCEQAIGRLNAALKKAGEKGNAGLPDGDIRYAFAGENAREADLQALEDARRMEEQGVAAETIYRETGWYKGAEGKWRFEIDDSGMEYRRQGDLRHMDDPEYREYLELWDKVYARAEGSEEDIERVRELDRKYGGVGRVSAMRLNNGQAKLSDIITHDELFDNYPELRNATVIFKDLPPGERGSYNRDTNTITLSEQMRHAPEDTIVHEVQHAIQKIEGFTSGSNPDYWKGSAAASARAEAVQRIQNEIENLRSMLPYEEESADLIRDGIEMLETQLNDINFYLYMQTAGEIEARDAASRRKLTAEQRRETMPDTGDENTVFAEGSETGLSKEEKATSQELIDLLRESIPSIEDMNPVAMLSGEEFARKPGVLLSEQVNEFFDSLNNVVDRDGFGTVRLENWGVKADIAHGVGKAKANAFAAVPDVIKYGRQIDFKENWKNKGKDTYVFAAPIVSGQSKEYMAVIVKKGYDNRFYLHEVVDEKGNIIIIKNDNDSEQIKTGSYGQARVTGNSEPLSNVMITGAEDTVKSETDLQATIRIDGREGQVAEGEQGEKAGRASNTYKDYITPEAQARYAVDPRFEKWKYKNLAYISAAAWDGANIPYEVLAKIPELREARARAQRDSTSLGEHPKGADPKIDARRDDLMWRLLDDEHGSAVFEGGKIRKVNNEEDFSGPVARERKAFLVIGRPAGGKSSVFANPLSNKHQARILDSDTVKPWLEGYDGGYGAGYVQDESASIMEEALKVAIKNGENMIIPKIGGKSCIALAEMLKSEGYTVELYYNEVAEGSSLMRAASRFAEKGRYLDLSYLTSIKDKPEKTFREYADSGLFSYAEWRNNDVGFGEEPSLVWNSDQGPLGSQRRGDAGADTRGGRTVAEPEGVGAREGRGPASAGGRGEVGDIRFSLRAPAADPELERARQQAEYWKQLALKNSGVKDVDKLTRDLMRGYGSRASRSEMSGRMRQLEEFLRSGGSEAEARATARQMAEDMLNKAAVAEDAADSEYHAAFRRYFRTNSISVPEEVKRGWPDGWGRFRKRYFGRLNLKNDGMDVTKIYREASQQWPDLLPSDEVVMRAQDQLETIAEVLDNLEPNMVNPYGSGPEFDAAVDSLAEDIISSLTRTEEAKGTAREEARRERIDRSIDELENREEQQQRFIDDPAELIAASRAAKQKQQQAQKIMRTLRLNQQESKLADSLLSGALTVDQLPDGIDRRGVLQAYRAKLAAREAQAPVDEYNARRRDKLDQDAADLTEHSDEWKDRKSRFGYDRETARRNIMDIVKDEAEAKALIRTYIDPIREHEAEKNRMVARYNARIKALKLETRTRRGNQVSEAHAVQYVGELEFIRDWLEQLPEGETRGDVTYDEAMSLLNEFWTENPNLDKARIHAAVAEFRSIYDEIFAMINEARVLNGYAPIDYRKGYFPHFTSNSADSIIQSLANGLGLGVEVTELPTSIAGTTHLFRPGIQWSGHMLQRTGNETDYNVLEGWDRYIPAVANIIYHTEDIQNLRALERVLRSKYSDTTVRDEIERTRNDRNLTETQKNSILDELFKRDTTQLNYFVQWLREYTNQLAGKRADLDRVAEAEAGRKLYRIVQKFENRVAANMLGGNLSSAMTNFVPLFQAWGNVRTSSMLRAMWDTTVGAIKHDGFRDGSDFLVNRRGYEAMYQTLFDKTKDKLFIPFNIIDDFVSETIVRARYYDEMRNNPELPAEVALAEADIFAGSVLADRAVGELPVIFNSKNPFVKVFTMFQVEVNNDLSHFFKDIPRDAKKKGMAAVFFCILKYVLGVHIFNDLFEALFGRRISFDPLDMLNDLAADATGYKLPNGFELAADLIRTGEWKGWEAFESDKGDDFFGDLLGKDGDLISWLENLPFLGSLLGGGRYPILSALPEQAQFSSGLQAFADLIKKEGEQENADAYDLQKMYKAVRAPLAYFIPPAFGGQARKIAEGLYAASKGGSYTITTEGEKRLQYPIEGVADIIRASIFGKTATRAGKKWVRSDFDTLSTEQTAAYIDLVTAGSDSQKIYDILHDLKGEERDSIAKAYALASADLKDSERVRLLDALVSESQSEKFAAMMTEGGLTFRQCAEVYDKYHELSKMGELKDSDDSYVYKKAYLATQFAAWIDGEGYTDEQKEVIEGQYKFWNMVPAEAGNYERFTAAGLSIDKALDLTDDWSQLKALPGSTYVSTAQKIGAVAAAGYLTEKERQNVVRSLMDDEKNADGVSQQTKFDQYIVGYQVPIECYSQYLTQSNGLKGDDLNGDGKTDSGSLVKKKLAVIDRLPLQPGQKTALALFATGNAESTIRKYAPWLR